PKEYAALYLTPGVRLTVNPNGLVSGFGRSPRCLHRWEEFLDRHPVQPRAQCRDLRWIRAAFLRDADDLDRGGRKASIDKGHQVLDRRVRECRAGVMAITDDQPRYRVTTGRFIQEHDALPRRCGTCEHEPDLEANSVTRA